MQNLKPAKLKAQTSNCSWMCFLFILAKLGVDQLHTYALNYLFIFSYKIKLLSFKMRISTMFASSNFKFGLHRVQLQWSEVKLLMCFLPLLWLESHINSTWLIRIFLFLQATPPIYRDQQLPWETCQWWPRVSRNQTVWPDYVRKVLNR